MDQTVNIKINTLSGQAMHTREKIGNLCKRVLCHILENKKGVKTFKDTVTAIAGDTKKVIDILFVFEGIGFITRITKNKFVYTGFRGVVQRIIEFIRLRLRKHKRYNTKLELSDDINIGGRPFNVKTSIGFSKFLSSVMCTMLLDSSKTITRNDVDLLFDEATQNSKEHASKNSINDALSILFALNLVEKNESNDNITWTGPDCINSAGVTLESAADLDNFENLLKPKSLNFDAKELQFYKVLLKEEITTNKFLLKPESFSKDVHAESMVKDPNSNLNLYHFSNFEPGGYALLKGKDWQYIMTKPYAIIGRATSKDGSKPKKYKWEVDVDLSKNSSVSRQHAVILYNFEEDSKKNPVKVGNYSYDFKDKPCPLTSKTHIVLGGESFYFYLPNLPREKKDEINEEFEEKKEEGDDMKLEEGDGEGEGDADGDGDGDGDADGDIDGENNEEDVKKEGSDGEDGERENEGDGDGEDGEEDIDPKLEDEELSQE